MNKIVCYTCITGNYDKLLEPYIVSNNIDYVCFTDNPCLISKYWQIRPIPNELLKLSKVKQQRIIKICPHKWLYEYDISIWIDGNIQVKNDLNNFIRQYNLEKTPLYVRKHLQRDCIYDEANECIKLKKDSKENVFPQIQKYKNKNFPSHYGLVETNILLRKHNILKCQIFDNYWATELLNGSHRDQLCFNYICWKTNFKYEHLFYQQFITKNRSEFFDRIQHNEQQSYNMHL